jgi:predicted permease
MNGLLQDIRHAFRQLRKSPGFTAVAVVSLAFGIGAGTAVFSLVNAILLRSMPVPSPQELRVLRWNGVEARVPSLNGQSIDIGNRTTADAFHHPAFLQLREHCAAQAEVFGFSPNDEVIARARGEAFAISGMMVSDNFFSTLGVRPFLGRPLVPGDDFASAATNVVISHGVWENQFGLDPAVIGQTLTLNTTPFTIVGVLPPEFPDVMPGLPRDFYVPMAAQSPFLYRPIHEDFHWFVRLMARLKPGARDAQLRAALEVAFARGAGAIMKEPKVLLEPGNAGLTLDRVNYQRSLLLMLGAVGLILLVTCANLAGLSLARGAARQHELSVRAALGAGRWRLIRQSLSESFLLALLGGGLGVLLALCGRTAISRLLAGSVEGLRYDLSLDHKVLGFSLFITMLTALLSGLLPALRAGRANPADGFDARGSAPRLLAGRVLVAMQICFSLLLMIGAGLYVRTLINLSRIDAGFDTRKLLLFQLNVKGSGYANAQPKDFYARVQTELAAIPGVQSASLIEFPLISGGGSTGGFSTFSGRPNLTGTNMETRRLRVGETFFQTLGIPLLQGRGMEATDDEARPKVIVVNETFVRRYLPKENPLGLTLNMWNVDWEIVGVCRDAKYNALRQSIPPTTYFPFRQMFYSRFAKTHLRQPYFAIRTSQPPLSLVASVRKVVAALDADVAMTDIATQEAIRDRAIGQERLLAILCGALAALALLLSCIGLYGLMAYHVARRTGEIGIRMALGATDRDIAGPILSEALLLGALGVTAGVPASLGLARVIQGHLFGVAPNDPITLIGTSVLLILVALLSAWLPARRAAKVDPTTALRNQ